MAEEACAPTSRMRSLAKCFEELSSANVPPDSLAPPQPKAGEEVPSYYMPAEMLPPRESRLNVREQRKEAIFTSSTLDFVSLSACGDLSGFSGGDLSLSLPACGESTLQSRMPTPRCEEGPQQARASPGRKRRCSQESLAEEMSRSYHGEAASAKKARQRVQKTSSETLYSAPPEGGGSSKNAPRTASQMSHNSTHSLAGKTSSSNDDKAIDEVGGFELNVTKLLQQMEGDPTHPRPESRLDNRSESSMSIISQNQNQNQKERRTPLPPHLRTNGSTAGTVGPTPSVKDLEDGPSRMGMGSRQGDDGMGRFSRMSRQDSIGSSLSGWTGNQGASNFAVVTPPSAPDAFQAHELLVKCPAPKRPVACSRVNAPFGRPMNRTLEVGRSIEAQGPTLARPRGLPRATSRSSLSVLEASHTADDLVALRRNGSRVALQRIPSEAHMLQRMPAASEGASAEDLAQCALHFGVV